MAICSAEHGRQQIGTAFDSLPEIARKLRDVGQLGSISTVPQPCGLGRNSPRHSLPSSTRVLPGAGRHPEFGAATLRDG